MAAIPLYMPLFFLPVNMMELETFAKIKNVPVFRAGTHNGLTFSDADIDEAIASTNECLPFLMESIERGEYRENPTLSGVRKIPHLLNLGHGRFLAESLKELVKDLSVSFHKQGDWIAATFDGVRSDVAEFLKDRFPMRSVELIPSLYNPLTGRTYKNVIRSVAFLPGDIPPAVSGQTPDLAIEFEQAPILTLFSEFDEKEKEAMKDETTGIEMNAEKEAIRAAEFAELTAQIQAFEERLSKTEAEKAAIEQRLNAAETKNKAADIEMFCERLRLEHHASPAFMEKARPLFIREANGVIEFGANEDLLKGFVEWVVKNAEAIAVAMGEQAPAEQKEPAPKDPQEARKFALDEAAQKLGVTLKDNYSQVWAFAAKSNPDLFS